jgi:hypothetical protein
MLWSNMRMGVPKRRGLTASIDEERLSSMGRSSSSEASGGAATAMPLLSRISTSALLALTGIALFAGCAEARAPEAAPSAPATIAPASNTPASSTPASTTVAQSDGGLSTVVDACTQWQASYLAGNSTAMATEIQAAALAASAASASAAWLPVATAMADLLALSGQGISIQESQAQPPLNVVMAECGAVGVAVVPSD